MNKKQKDNIENNDIEKENLRWQKIGVTWTKRGVYISAITFVLSLLISPQPKPIITVNFDISTIFKNAITLYRSLYLPSFL